MSGIFPEFQGFDWILRDFRDLKLGIWIGPGFENLGSESQILRLIFGIDFVNLGYGVGICD